MTAAERIQHWAAKLGKPTKIIYGCESRGDAQLPYLTRYTLCSGRLGALYLHVFHRSDHDVMHDHPWSFASLILVNGYYEVTPAHQATDSDRQQYACRYGLARRRRRVWPGMLLFRGAKHIHRVELLPGREAVTLVWRGNYVREWGFWALGGWERWTEYFKRLGCS